MTERREQNPVLRIVLALDALPHGEAAIDAAASLAAELRAELQGLFVEDINLLRLAGLPFTREVDAASAAIRPLDMATMERALRIKAAEIRRAMATKAEEHRLQWSFQVARGEFIRSTLAAATEADLLVLTREGRPARGAIPTAAAPIVVAFDGSASGAGALETAARLVRRLDRPLVILIVADTDEERAAIQSSLTQWLQAQQLVGSVHEPVIRAAEDLVQAARRYDGRVLVAHRGCRLLDETTIGALVDELRYPVVLVG